MNRAEHLLRSKAGALQLALGTALGTAAVCAMAFFGIAQHWTRLVRVQLELDRCVGRAALEFRGHLDSLERSNQRLRVLRAAVGAALASGNPAAISAARGATSAQAGLQDLELLKWRHRQIRWILEAECRSRPPAPGLPDLPFRRPPRDLWGETPLEWDAESPRRFSLIATRAGRQARAFVVGQKGSPAWAASWRAPHEPTN
jgi:hypothetical protein